MDTRYNEPREGQDGLDGFEDVLLKPNCKDGVVYLDGLETGADRKFAFLLSLAEHGYVVFEDKKVVARRVYLYEDQDPSRDMPDGADPHTSCLCLALADGETQLAIEANDFDPDGDDIPF
jgi:hypothetical protein